MATDHDTATGPGGSSHPRPPDLGWRLRPIVDRSMVVLAGTAALSVLLVLMRRLVVNSPLDAPRLVAWGPAIDGAAMGVASLAALGLGLWAIDRRALVGLTAVGVFGLLATVAPPARLPAAGAILAGGTVAMVPRLSGQSRWQSIRRGTVAVGILAGAALAIGAAMGILPASARATGSLIALLGLAAAPLVVDPGKSAWAAGGLVAAVFLVVAAATPFVSGAALLVGWAVVGVPALVVAVGFGGIAAAFVAVFQRGQPLAVFGAVALFAAGVPATVPRTIAAVLGLTLFLAVDPSGGDIP